MDALESETVFQDPIEPERLQAAESPRLIISPPLHIRRQKLARSQVNGHLYYFISLRNDEQIVGAWALGNFHNIHDVDTSSFGNYNPVELKGIFIAFNSK